MNRQGTLFPQIEEADAQAEPRGFRYAEGIVTEEEEAVLAASLAQLDWKTFEFHGHIGNRRVVSFGPKYDYGRRAVETVAEMPEFLGDLLAKAARFGGCEESAFRQVGMNEYRRGAGVGWHRDKPQFGIIVGVSLLSPATMRFRKAEGTGWIRVSQTLEPRSIYILSGGGPDGLGTQCSSRGSATLLHQLPHVIGQHAGLSI